MFCRECGESIPNDSVYCPECGKPAGGADAPPQPQGGQQFLRPGTVPMVVPNYLVQSILVTVLCCLPAGIVALINASQANSKQSAGDYAGAMKAAKTAKQWCWIAVGAGAVVAAIYIVVTVLSVSTSDEF